MRSRIKTGDVFQITKNGPNYISLGKVTDTDNNEYIAATKNGNINPNGVMKPRTGRSKGRIHILPSTTVKRVHGHRPVDIPSVCQVHRRLSSHLVRTTNRDGVLSDAPNLLTQIADLRRSF